MSVETIATVRRDALVERMFAATVDALELYGVYLGAKLGLYVAMVDGAPRTAGDLAAMTGIDRRYAREWLEQQACAGYLDVADADAIADPEARRFVLPPEHMGVLADPDDPSHLAPLASVVAGVGQVISAVADAYRTGDGVDFAAYGLDFRHGQGGANRPLLKHDIGTWMTAMPDIEERLLSGQARVVDVGCGQGWGAIGMALAFPGIAIDGIDADLPSIRDAHGFAAGQGVGDRIHWRCQDATLLEGAGPYDLAFMVEVLHDLARPVEVLAAVRRTLAPGGVVLVVDERVSDGFTAPGDPVERLMYGWSITHCLPAAMGEEHSAATGTVMRVDTVREYAAAAGFSAVEVLPIENDVFRMYRLSA
jgi:SAM-dependent methyltransferase